MSGTKHRRGLVKRRISPSYKCERTTGSLFSHSDVCETTTIDHSHKDRQYVRSDIYQQNAGHEVNRLESPNKKYFGLVPGQKIVLTAEYLSGNQNLVADWHSRNINDSSDWCLNRQIFHQIQKLIGELEVDIFASRLNYQLKKIVSWKPDPMSLATDAFLLNWTKIKGYAPILFNREMSCQSEEGEIHNNSVWQTQSWYSTLLQILIQGPIKLPTFPELILSPQGKVHPLTKNNNLTLGFGKYQGR